jgi:hypothetical protein
MGIEITKRGRMPTFNAANIAREIQRFAPGAIIERTMRGLDLKGQPFAGYSARYRRQLKRMGEDPKVDLRMSGGLLNSVKARDATLRADSVEVVIAPDTGTSPQYRAPSERRAYRQAGLAEGRFDLAPPFVLEAIDVVDAAAADDAEDGRGSGGVVTLAHADRSCLSRRKSGDLGRFRV